MIPTKSPEEQAALDALFVERHRKEGLLIMGLEMILNCPKGQGADTPEEKVKWAKERIASFKRELEKLFTAYERRFP